MDKEYEWKPVQRVLLNNNEIMVIDRVTPSGRAVIEELGIFGTDGLIRGELKHRIYPITSDNTDLARWLEASSSLSKAINLAAIWHERAKHFRGRTVASGHAIYAERLTAAIEAILGENVE